MNGDLKSLFLLDPSIHFLNHGSFGACPKQVFEVYQTWQRRLESQPVLFLGRELQTFDCEARKVLGSYLCVSGDDLVFVPNATQGVNVIARSLAFTPGDEILTTNHEYGACEYTWEFVCQKTGAHYVRQEINLPAQSEEEIAEAIWAGVSERTKLIYLSHITSPTALRLPVEIICKRARERGIKTLVDGAHAPGQIELDLEKIGADWYVGNCHKWLLSPKGAGFLYARQEVQSLVEPLVVSWGYHAQPQNSAGSQFLDFLGWSGTKDPAAYLSVPAAIQFMQENQWALIRESCHTLLSATLAQICELVDMDPIYPSGSDLYFQMAAAPLPIGTDLVRLKNKLYTEFKVEAPVIDWNGRKFIRVSVQGYNTQDDLDALLYGLESLLR